MPDASGNYQNSGLLGFTNHLAVITPELMARYNILIKTYGNKFSPPLAKNAGLSLSAGHIMLDKEHLSDLIEMVQWQLNPELAPK